MDISQSFALLFLVVCLSYEYFAPFIRVERRVYRGPVPDGFSFMGEFISRSLASPRKFRKDAEIEDGHLCAA